MNVRQARLEDAPAIARVHVDVWRAAYKDHLPADLLAGLSVSERERRWQRFLQEASSAAFVAEEDSVVAFGSVGPCRDEDKDARVAELLTLYALPEVWGTGAGRQVWEACAAWLSDAGFGEVTLWVLAGNERAVRFYERAGFHADGTSKTETWRDDVQIHELRYTKTL